MSRIITASQAFAQGITADSLLHVADWNSESAEKAKTKSQKERYVFQAAKLREIADEMENTPETH